MFSRRVVTGMLFLGALGFGSYGWTTGVTVAQGKETLEKTITQLLAQTNLSDTKKDALNTVKKQVTKLDPTLTLTEQDLIAITKDFMMSCEELLTPEQLTTLATIQAGLIERLRGFRVTGMAISVDPNGAFIVDTQDPKFTLYFKNAAGELQHRKYQANIESIGFKFEFAINVHFIFFINTDLNYYDANTSIPLSWGIECGVSTISVPLAGMIAALLPCTVNLTYASLENESGGLLKVTAVFGLQLDGLSLVTGGSLEPVEKTIKK